MRNQNSSAMIDEKTLKKASTPPKLPNKKKEKVILEKASKTTTFSLQSQ